jgi:hypothetical protein
MPERSEAVRQCPQAMSTVAASGFEPPSARSSDGIPRVRRLAAGVLMVTYGECNALRGARGNAERVGVLLGGCVVGSP